jgi:hypothetical protein
LRASSVDVARRAPDGGGDEARADASDGEQLERGWDRALDAADDAVSATSRAHALPAKDIAAASERIREERRWFARFRPTLRKLLPRRSKQPPEDV